ncbi:hypothetical protein [Silanimonas sp.]|uniref:hypothetical protein n=1 Tax=Silanimonas sp. TaxID=1929290 RepID=UPI0022CC2AB5|nr:hypothetical protein [Silanimonas sp.]MCZ8113735.1 hypothetical protein [Silanimonas sp.]
MSTFALLRATTRLSDAVWAVALALIGVFVGATFAMAAGGTDAVSAQALRFVPLAAVPLLLRYEFSSGPAVLFWFDAARQGMPGVTAASLRAEALRAVLLVLALILPMGAAAAAVGDVRALPATTALGVAIAAIGIGGLTAVAPYRWIPFAIIASLGLVVAIVSGWVPTHGPIVLALGIVVFAACALAIRWRLRTLLRRGEDPEVGGDYAFVFGLGRHGGGAFSAPNSAPLAVLMGERRAHAAAVRQPDNPDARIRALLGPEAWHATVATRPHFLQWAALIGLWPLLMLAFLAILFQTIGVPNTSTSLAALIWLTMVVMWGVVMGGVMQLQYGRVLGASIGSGEGLDAELRLLPGVLASASVWDRRLRPLWLLPGLGVAALVVAVAATVGVGATGLGWLSGIAALELWRMRLSLQAALRGSRSARRFAMVAGAVTGLLLVLGVPLWAGDLLPGFNTAMARIVPALGPVALALALVSAGLLAAAECQLRRGQGASLLLAVGMLVLAV